MAADLDRRPSAGCGPVERREDQLIERVRLRVGPQPARLDPTHVEQVGDEPVESLGLEVDGLGALPALRPATTPRSGSIRLPAAARIEASGVRRSCETESSRAVFSASLWRASSALVASARRRSCSTAWPIWSAAAASMRVSARDGCGAPIGHETPTGLRGRVRPPRCSPGRPPSPRAASTSVRSRRPALRPGAPGHAHGSSVKARLRACASGRSRSNGRRKRRSRVAVGRHPFASRYSSPGRCGRATCSVARRSVSTIDDKATSVCDRVASARLTWNRTRASRSRTSAASARLRWRAARWPTTIPTASSRTRFDQLLGVGHDEGEGRYDEEVVVEEEGCHGRDGRRPPGRSPRPRPPRPAGRRRRRWSGRSGRAERQ